MNHYVAFSCCCSKAREGVPQEITKSLSKALDDHISAAHLATLNKTNRIDWADLALRCDNGAAVDYDGALGASAVWLEECGVKSLHQPQVHHWL